MGGLNCVPGPGATVVGRNGRSLTRRPLAPALTEHEEYRNMKPKNTICLWFDKDALEAARFYTATFPDSKVSAVHKAPGDYPSGKEGDVLTVEFTVIGVPCLGLNGGPAFRHSEAFSFQVATDGQEETDRLWKAIIGNGGQASACGWCKDKWGLSWQITPRALTAAIADPDRAAAKRAFEAMMQMKKIVIAAIEAAPRGCRSLAPGFPRVASSRCRRQSPGRRAPKGISPSRAGQLRLQFVRCRFHSARSPGPGH